ncbi:GSCFA domain-containing protein [Hoylesella nanceiensis]|uniref:GSCFA domain-containing protein n=1 Tax=Hoylesella nanceiensis TaxID=425941 RepID=UPI001CB1E3D3|nr:GSCFA domain-containing protein [Hoylesella nanceiensis]MBF1420473.1 GSCFA domain-containing protein [Hoylesella nanceiensis]MBF1454412.1 GSCFA domain-containing protein [Hoylesella nanceiensis]
MKFRTIVDIPKSSFSINPFARMLFVGSCFADNMGKKFTAEKFNTLVNPYGVMYNPASVYHTIQRISFVPDYAILTLGTNRVYILKETNEIVDNCRKQPQNLFREEQLSIEECVNYLSLAIDRLIELNKDIKIIITVSPIRYAKYGFHGSQLSKATLLLASQQLLELYPDRIEYFPAYEIVNDELRDYRFYAADMLHPTEQAVDYIWERFSETYFSQLTADFIVEWRPLKQALAHKVLNATSNDFIKFKQSSIEKLNSIAEKYPLLDVTNELQHFESL